MEAIHLELRLVDCGQACHHCLVCGRPGDHVMPLSTVARVLAELRATAKSCGFFVLDDLAAYPDWPDLLRLMNEYDLNSPVLTVGGADGFFVSRLAELRALGKSSLQVALHGVGETHDRAVGKPRAFAELMRLISAALSEGFSIWIMIFAGRHNVKQLPILVDTLLRLGVAREDIGITTPQHLGRAVHWDRLRLQADDLTHREGDFRLAPKHRSEAEWIQTVAVDNHWDRPAFSYNTKRNSLYVDKNLDVYLVNWNPYGMPGTKRPGSDFRLGNLQDESLAAILDRCKEQRPPALRLLEEVSVQRLAEVVGRDEQLLYPHEDVPKYVWPYRYLRLTAG